jgi:uncharacterized phage protein (TIGR01671 family)
MREIKFRAWSPSNEAWRYDWSISVYGEIFDLNEERLDNDLILEQYTGLKDNNGKEIYEGDIWAVETGGSYHNGISTKSKTWGEISIHPDGIHIGTLALWANSHIFGYGIGEIIGNTHENPKLLK